MPDATVNLTNDAQLEQVRTMLLGPEQAELVTLRKRIAEFEALIPRLTQLEGTLVDRFGKVDERLARVESTVVATAGRATAVGEVLVEAVSTDREPGTLGDALTPDVEHALSASARLDSNVLAEALYPVMGPALRKMIADIFSMNSSAKGQTFVVEQTLLIDRHSGLLIACRTADGAEAKASIVVSGMIDAIQHFVQDAFGKEHHDGLQDLRVGDTSVLVEWGPNAVLASVVRGLPTTNYRHLAARTLEEIHERFGPQLKTFDGNTNRFHGLQSHLIPLFEKSATPETKAGARLAIAGTLLLVLVLVGLVLWIV